MDVERRVVLVDKSGNFLSTQELGTPYFYTTSNPKFAYDFQDPKSPEAKRAMRAHPQVTVRVLRIQTEFSLELLAQ